MRVVESLRRRLTASSSPRFECGLCATTFDREPPNCPTCGSFEIREL